MDAIEGTETNSVETGWAVGIEHNVFVRVVYALIASLGITGNVLVCFVLIRIPSLRNRASQLIVHLAITDLLTCVWVVPFHLFPSTPTAPHGILGEIFCRLFVSKYPLWLTIITSIYTLLSVNLERFVAIVYPLYYRKMFTFKNIAFICLFCWVIGSVSSSWFFFNFDYDHELGSCKFVPFSPKVAIVIGLYIFSVIYLIPISFNTVAQYYMIKTLKQQATSMETRSETKGELTASTETSQRNSSTKSWQLKTAQDLEKTLLIVVVTFAVCWAPNQIIFLLYNLGCPIDFTRWYYHWSVMLALFTSCVNPVIYTFKHKPFRYGLMKSLGLRSKSVRPEFPPLSRNTRSDYVELNSIRKKSPETSLNV